MFANYEMVVNIKTFLLPDEDAMRKWDAAQCEIYCRVVLISFRNYISQAYRGDSSELSWAMGEITIAASDLCTLNERSSAGDSDVLRRLALVIQFIKDAVRILDQEGVPDHVHIRVRVGDDSLPVLYGYIVTMIDTVISYTLKVSSPKLVRDIQYKSVWTKLFYHSTFNGPAGQVVAFKLRRRLYNQIAGIRIDEMGCLRNFRGAKILRFCLNVLALAVIRGTTTRATEDFITEYFTELCWPGRKSTSSGYIATTHALLRAAWETTSPTTQSTYAWPTPILPRGR